MRSLSGFLEMPYIVLPKTWHLWKWPAGRKWNCSHGQCQLGSSSRTADLASLMEKRGFPVRYDPASQRQSLRRLGSVRIDNWVGQHCISLALSCLRLMIFKSGFQGHRLSHVNKKQREAFKRLRCLVFQATANAMPCSWVRTELSFCALPFPWYISLKGFKASFHTELLILVSWLQLNFSLPLAGSCKRQVPLEGDTACPGSESTSGGVFLSTKEKLASFI